jgi:DNA (cytosine-5)-methyltransferase 1
MGYSRAGFEVVGVDIKPQSHYPFEFIEDDAVDHFGELLEYANFDAIHASPPCQAYSQATAWRGARENHPRLIATVAAKLRGGTLPYVIENVAGARAELERPILLCGTMFGLPITSHRFFEVPWMPLTLLPRCKHTGDEASRDHGSKQPESAFRDAMECDWMAVREAREAIPPAYTEWIGKQLIATL